MESYILQNICTVFNSHESYFQKGVIMIKIKTNGEKAWVTFTLLPSETIESAAISGEWNGWEEEPMKQKKSGEYYITKILKRGSVYPFGYKINNCEWKIDEECPAVPSPFSSHNSLLEL